MSPALPPAWAICRDAHRPPHPSTASSPPPVRRRITIPTRCPVIITSYWPRPRSRACGGTHIQWKCLPHRQLEACSNRKKRRQDPRELRRRSWHRRRQTDHDRVMQKTGASQHRHARVPPESVAGTPHLPRPALPELHHQIGREVRIGPARGTGLNLDEPQRGKPGASPPGYLSSRDPHSGDRPDGYLRKWGLPDVAGPHPLGRPALGSALPHGAGTLGALLPRKGTPHKKVTDWARQMVLQLRRWLPGRTGAGGG